MFLLLGYGISNQSISKYFDEKDIKYDIYDDSLFKKTIDINKYDIVIKSGSIKNDHNIIKEAKLNNIKILSDLELFYRFVNYRKQKTIITITGTNGKSTTVSLIKKIIGDSCDLMGNIGYPLFDFVENKKNVIIEASSFMLEYVYNFHSKINVILNLKSNHLEHHNTLKKYFSSKLNLLKNIKENDFLIYNYDDLLLRKLIENYKCYKIPFSSKQIVKGGYIYSKYLYFNKRKIIKISDIQLIGEHNLENVLAACCVCYCYGIPIEQIERGIKAFKGIEHRLELLVKKNNIMFFNDSKSTNYLSMSKAIEACNGKILLICGGQIKKDNILILEGKTKKINKVLCFGENKHIINDYFGKNDIGCWSFNNLEDLMKNLKKYLENIDIVLFSPGSPSYDQYKNFEERGRNFKKLLKQYI